MNPQTKALTNKIKNQRMKDDSEIRISAKKAPSPFQVIKGALGRTSVGRYLKENDRKNKAAAAEMDKRYPAGWAQSAANMTELNSIKKTLK